MNFERLSKSESDLVGEALRAAADGPFFPDWEFQTLMGAERDAVRRVAREWPSPSAGGEEVGLAVNNSINWLLHYPRRKQEHWSEWFSIDPAGLRALHDRLRGRSGENAFERMM